MSCNINKRRLTTAYNWIGVSCSTGGLFFWVTWNNLHYFL